MTPCGSLLGPMMLISNSTHTSQGAQTVNEDRWTKVDLHVHSVYSDGADRIPAILQHVAEKTDLRMIAITDHDRIAGAWLAKRVAPQYGLDVVIGEEVTTKRGHVLAFFLEKAIPAGLSIRETVDRIHMQGGIAVLAHPYDMVCGTPLRHNPHLSASEWRSYGLDGLEGMNGCQVLPASNIRAQALGTRLGLPLTGGSDAHHKGVIGSAYTLFPGKTQDDLKRAILNGTCRPAGQQWSLEGYAGWFVRALLPRPFRSVFQPRPLSAAEFA